MVATFSPQYVACLQGVIAPDGPASPLPVTVNATNAAVVDARRLARSSREFAALLIVSDVLTVLEHRPDLWAAVKRELLSDTRLRSRCSQDVPHVAAAQGKEVSP